MDIEIMRLTYLATIIKKQSSQLSQQVTASVYPRKSQMFNTCIQ